MLQNIGSTELMLIVLVLVVIFGSGKIAELGKNLGKTSRELKIAKKEYEDALTEDIVTTSDEKVEEV